MSDSEINPLSPPRLVEQESAPMPAPPDPAELAKAREAKLDTLKATQDSARSFIVQSCSKALLEIVRDSSTPAEPRVRSVEMLLKLSGLLR